MTPLPPSLPEQVIQQGAAALLSIAPAMPRASLIEPEIADCRTAQERGYFLADEDERIRAVFASYLRVRAALLGTLAELEPLVHDEEHLDRDQRIRAFAVAWCAGCMLLRSAQFMIDQCCELDVVWKKLDEAEPRFNIPAGQFTQVYRSATHTETLRRLYHARDFAQRHKRELVELGRDPVFGPVIELLHEVRHGIQTTGRYYAGKVLDFQVHAVRKSRISAFKQVMFSLFEVSGRAIAEMRNPFHTKRVDAGVIDEVRAFIRAGDVIVTRHDDAMSNLFLPGFWPHGALCIGTEAERERLGVAMSDERRLRSTDPVLILEARKDGVLFRMLPETLYVDAFTVMRPRLDAADLGEALGNAITHEGKGYDFEFDFSRADRLVCTELVYRAYHGVGPCRFELKERSGRVCLSAEDLLDYADDDGIFDAVAVFGVGGNELVTGDTVREVVRKSYRGESGERR